MPISDAQRKANYKYKTSKIKRIPLDVQKDYYDNVIKPAADRAGSSVNGYIKKAISEKIERDMGGTC